MKLKNVKKFAIAGVVGASVMLSSGMPYNVINDDIGKVYAAEQSLFPDVSTTHWGYQDIKALTNKSIIFGSTDGRFLPNDKIQRLHVAMMFDRAMELKPVHPVKSFTDIPSNYEHLKLIEKVQQAGIFVGDENGKFKPTEPMTRAAMAQVLMTAFNLEGADSHPFPDVKKGNWAENAINALYANGITSGTGNGLFEPNKEVSRAEFASFLNRAMNLENATEPEDKPNVPVDKPTEPEDKPDVPGDKPTEPEEKPSLPGDKPIEYTEYGVDKNLVKDDVFVSTLPVSFNSWVVQESIKAEKQDLLRSINKKHNVDLKFTSIVGSGTNLHSDLIPKRHDLIGNDVTFFGEGKNSFDISLHYESPVVVELGKEWVKLVNPEIEIGIEIDQIIREFENENYLHSIRVSFKDCDVLLKGIGGVIGVVGITVTPK